MAEENVPQTQQEAAPAINEEVTMEDLVSQLMVDNMALKSLLIQKGVFSQQDFDAMAEAVTEEISKQDEGKGEEPGEEQGS